MSSARSPARYVIDPDDPRAPPQDVWDAMSPEERAEVVANLPSEFPISESSPPEGDPHFEAKVLAREVLRGYFRRTGRNVYIACELPVYYPGERMFAPDVMAVVDVPIHPREGWVVNTENEGLDVALEIHGAGRRKKDIQTNVERYARLGIPEYFVFDRRRLRLFGYRLLDTTSRVYQPIVPQGGYYTSQRLGLELMIEGERLRFCSGLAALPESDELIAKLHTMIADVENKREEEERRAEEAERRVEEEVLRAEEEKRRAKLAEARLAAALAELEKLRGSRS